MKSEEPRPKKGRPKHCGDNEGAQRLRELLPERGDLEKFARRLGVHQSVVGRWRSGTRSPEARFRMALREQFDIPILAWDKPLQKAADVAH